MGLVISLFNTKEGKDVLEEGRFFRFSEIILLMFSNDYRQLCHSNSGK
jgi:hypothetical protein